MFNKLDPASAVSLLHVDAMESLDDELFDLLTCHRSDTWATI